MQLALNPPSEHSIEKFGYSFSIGDKVMQIENNYDRDVYNGDIGFVTGIDRDEEEIAVEFDGRLVSYPFGELDELVLCYATTIHKSQGSEYPVVVIPISTQHYMMLKRNLIYTGITRGKKLVVLVGQKKALAIAVKGKQVERRWSKLKMPGYAKQICVHPVGLSDHFELPLCGREYGNMECPSVPEAVIQTGSNLKIRSTWIAERHDSLLWVQF